MNITNFSFYSHFQGLNTYILNFFFFFLNKNREYFYFHLTQPRHNYDKYWRIFCCYHNVVILSKWIFFFCVAIIKRGFLIRHQGIPCICLNMTIVLKIKKKIDKRTDRFQDKNVFFSNLIGNTLKTKPERSTDRRSLGWKCIFFSNLIENVLKKTFFS